METVYIIVFDFPLQPHMSKCDAIYDVIPSDVFITTESLLNQKGLTNDSVN